MYAVSSEFHTAVLNGSKQKAILEFSDAIFSNSDIALNGGISFTEPFNAQQELTLGLAPSAYIDVSLLNESEQLNSFGFGTFNAYLGVNISSGSYTPTAGATASLVIDSDVYSVHSTSPYVKLNGADIGDQPSFVPEAIVYWGGYLYVMSSGGSYFKYDITVPSGASYSPNDALIHKAMEWSDNATAFTFDGSDYIEYFTDGTYDSYEMCPLGTFHADKPATSRKIVVKFTAYDNMDLFDTDITDWFAGLSYPTTLGDIYADLCTEIGVTTTTSTFINSTHSYTYAPFESASLTGRQLLKYIAEMACSMARFDRDGNLELVWFSDVSHEISSHFEISIAEYEVAAVDALQVQSEVTQAVSNTGTGSNVYVLLGGKLINGFSEGELDAIASPISTRLFAYDAFTPISVRVIGDWSLQAGDIVDLEIEETDTPTWADWSEFTWGELYLTEVWPSPTTYSLPIYTQTIKWVGNSCRATLNSTGNELRDASSVLNRDAFLANQKANAIEALAEEYGLKATIYYQDSEPSEPQEGDFWYDTDADPVVIYRYNGSSWDDITSDALESALDAAADAQSTADGKIITFAQASAPTAEATGDLWIDTDDDNTIYRWSGSAWVEYQPNATAISDLVTSVDSKITIFYQDAQPTANVAGDIWYDTDADPVVIYRWSGSAWVDITSVALEQALDAASDAQSTADGKIITFAQDAEPTAEAVGDLWVDTDDDNKLYRWSGSAWVDVQDGNIGTLVTQMSAKTTIFYQDAEPTATATGDLWYDTDADPVVIYRWSGSAWVDITSVALDEALTAAADAEAVADGKIVTFVQTSAPTAEAEGDLWIDSDDDNKMYRWSGSAWVSVRDGTIATAQSTADSKTTTFSQASPPTSLAIGDTWIDTDDYNKIYIAASIGADEITAGEWELKRVASGELITSHITVQDDEVTIASGGTLTIESGGDITIESGGALSVTTPTTLDITAGSGSSAIGITNDTYFLYAGDETAADAPFSVTLGGKVHAVDVDSLTGTFVEIIQASPTNSWQKIYIGEYSLDSEIQTGLCWSSDKGNRIVADASDVLHLYGDAGIEIESTGSGNAIVLNTAGGGGVYVNGTEITTGTTSGLKIDTGTTTISGYDWKSVSFSFTFSSAPKVVATYAQNATSSGIAPLKTQSVTTTGFQICLASGSDDSITRYVDWIAIGS